MAAMVLSSSLRFPSLLSLRRPREAPLTSIIKTPLISTSPPLLISAVRFRSSTNSPILYDVFTADTEDDDVIDEEDPRSVILDLFEDDEAICVWIAMPGFGKDHVRVTVEEESNVVTIVGEVDDDDDGVGDGGRRRKWRFFRRLDLGFGVFEKEKTRAQMRNGVLRLVVPKVKEEDRKDVIKVEVE